MRQLQGIRTTHAFRAGRILLLLGLLAGFCFAPVPAWSYGTAEFPCPAELAPRVEFWIRVFTEFSKDQRVIHDGRYPWVVYDVIEVPGLTQAQIKARVEQKKKEIARTLDRMAGRAPAGFSPEEQRIAGLLASIPERARYTNAGERVRSQPGIREQFRLGLQRAGRYRHLMDDVLRSAGLPAEIVNLPHVESSFHPQATSKAGARGLWQFMPATGRRFLRVQPDLDERLDPIRSTEAAARYLKEAHATLGSWPLAVVAYNHGVAGVARAKSRTGSTDIARILLEYDGPSFGFASQNFYCEFLAAIEVGENPQKYFPGEIEPDLPWVFHEFELPHHVRWNALARGFGVDPQELAELNPAAGPAYVSGQRPVPRGYRLRLPARHAQDAAALYAALPAADKLDRLPEPERYRVRSGDTLSGIARKHRVGLPALLRANGLSMSSTIRPGQLLVLPQGAADRL